MKKIILSFVFALSTALPLFAQLTEGHVSYSIDWTTDDPEKEMIIGMMQGSTLEMHFKDKLTRSEMKMGAMMTSILLTDEKSGELLMLISGMMGKKAIKSTTAEMEKNAPEKPEYVVTLVDENKTILGYACKKAILTEANGNETIFWYTDEITVSKKGQKFLNEDIPGFPMQFEIDNSGMKMKMTVTALEKTLDKKYANLFEMVIPEGYNEMTLEEMKAMGM